MGDDRENDRGMEIDDEGQGCTVSSQGADPIEDQSDSPNEVFPQPIPRIEFDRVMENMTSYTAHLSSNKRELAELLETLAGKRPTDSDDD